MIIEFYIVIAIIVVHVIIFVITFLPVTGSSLNVDFDNLDFEGYTYLVRAKCGKLVVPFMEVDTILFG